MRVFLLPFRLLYVVYASVLFVTLMIPVFLWALLALSIGRKRGGALVYYGCVVWADVWFFLVFIRHRNEYVQKPTPHGSYIYVANHISYLDAAVIPKTFRQPVRPLGKVEMAKIPLFGTIYKNVIVTVDRSSPQNRARSVQELIGVLKQEISVLVFPEGTFNTTGQPLKEFYDGAFRIAIETGTPIMPVLFLYTYNRMHYGSLSSLNPGRNRSVFLPEVSVDGLSVQDVGLLKQRVYQLMDEELRKRNVAWLQDRAV